MKATSSRSWAISWNIYKIWQLPRHRDNRWRSAASLWARRLESAPQKIKPRSHPIRAESSVLRSRSEKSFFLPRCIKKNKQLSMSRGVLWAQQWPQDREALEESAKTHAAARLRLRRPSGGSLWPSLSLCKNQCSPMMCYVKFPEAWFKWLDILHASLVILQCIAPKSTWTLHEKQM